MENTIEFQRKTIMENTLGFQRKTITLDFVKKFEGFNVNLCQCFKQLWHCVLVLNPLFGSTPCVIITFHYLLKGISYVLFYRGFKVNKPL